MGQIAHIEGADAGFNIFLYHTMLLTYIKHYSNITTVSGHRVLDYCAAVERVEASPSGRQTISSAASLFLEYNDVYE